MNTAVWTVVRAFGACRAAKYLPPRHRVVSVTPDPVLPVDHLLVEGALCPPPQDNGQPAALSVVMEERRVGAPPAGALAWFAHDPHTHWMVAAEAQEQEC